MTDENNVRSGSSVEECTLFSDVDERKVVWGSLRIALGGSDKRICELKCWDGASIM